MVKLNSRGQVIRVFTYGSNPGMRKHGADKAQHFDKNLATLDMVAHATRTPYRGVIVRKAVSK